jgi:hypothetical protein
MKEVLKMERLDFTMINFRHSGTFRSLLTREKARYLSAQTGQERPPLSSVLSVFRPAAGYF